MLGRRTRAAQARTTGEHWGKRVGSSRRVSMHARWRTRDELCSYFSLHDTRDSVCAQCARTTRLLSTLIYGSTAQQHREAHDTCQAMRYCRHCAGQRKCDAARPMSGRNVARKQSTMHACTRQNDCLSLSSDSPSLPSLYLSPSLPLFLSLSLSPLPLPPPLPFGTQLERINGRHGDGNRRRRRGVSRQRRRAERCSKCRRRCRCASERGAQALELGGTIGAGAAEHGRQGEGRE